MQVAGIMCMLQFCPSVAKDSKPVKVSLLLPFVVMCKEGYFFKNSFLALSFWLVGGSFKFLWLSLETGLSG